MLSVLPQSVAIVKRKHQTSVINLRAFSLLDNSSHVESTKQL